MKFLPTAFDDKMGIHISAELRVSAMQLRDHRVGWAADVMERAANHIDALEELQCKQEDGSEERD